MSLELNPRIHSENWRIELALLKITSGTVSGDALILTRAVRLSVSQPAATLILTRVISGQVDAVTASCRLSSPFGTAILGCMLSASCGDVRRYNLIDLGGG